MGHNLERCIVIVAREEGIVRRSQTARQSGQARRSIRSFPFWQLNFAAK